jgi:ParB family chromosome partitioning protein
MPISLIRDFANHPYRVRNDHITQDIVRDIEKTGRIETPAIVRPINSGYEMISGHRRKLACNLAGLESMPVIVRNMSDDEAVIAMVSANRQREEVLPSEKAQAYKMWMEAISRQGQRADLTCAPVEHKLLGMKSRDVIAEETGESREQIRRYIRLTELIPGIMELVDNAVVGEKEKLQMSFRPAVELSYLTKQEQEDLLVTMESEDRTPSLTQALQMKQLSAEGKLDMDSIFNLLREDKPNQKEQFKLPRDRIAGYIPEDFDDKKVADLIVKLLEGWCRRRERDRADDGAR